MAIVPMIHQLKITLNHMTPPIWRRFQVRSDAKLTQLHEIVQIVMGWEDYHMYAFDVGGIDYTDPKYIDEDMYELDHRDGAKVRLSQALPEVGSTMLYRYDFGDNWEHTIELERILDPEPGERYPVCMDGARACPREDCGGVGGYEELLEALADPEHEEHEDMKRWAGADWDPEKLDCFLVNLGLSRRVIIKAEEDTEPRPTSTRQRQVETGRTWITTLTHLLDENGLPPVDAPQELHDALGFFGAITQAGSSHPGSAQFCSTMVCRNTVGGKPCGGHLMISQRPDGVIHWHCPKCGEQGYISDWQGTSYDLSGAVENDPAQRTSVLVTPAEHKLLKGIITTSPEEDAVISGAVSTPDGVLISGGVGAFELLLGSIAADANHSDGVKHQRTMDRMYSKIERVVEG